tara:strand:+ start:114 stop:500 length:387 start_codon:yes stop_codon:yes gene_type:complete
MSNNLSLGVIHVKDVNLWAHVGVLEKERLYGQSFLVDFSLWLDVSDAARHDDLSFTSDYSVAIKGLQKLAFEINCHTIETFSECILDCLEDLFGNVQMKIFLRKCNPPIEGFNGSVGIERTRNLSILT